MNKDNKKTKFKGKIYTPRFIVNNVLDASGYYGENIIGKHIIDNSCGDGAFLVEIAERYCRQAKKINLSKDKLKKDLETFIHGIEIELAECERCKQKLDRVVKVYGLEKINWDIRCENTLLVNDYNGKMDFVIGNPPYVRVHNLGENFDHVKQFDFSKKGMTDLYIVFYEIGLKMLNKNGVLGYITPSSFFSSVAGRFLRSYIIQHNLLDKVVNLKHFQPFSATTYTAIVILKNNRVPTETEYFQYDEKNLVPYHIDFLQETDYYIENKFYFSKKEELTELKKILKAQPRHKFFEVKNGFATLADKFFIADFHFSDFVIPVVKASTGKWGKCLFPYNDEKIVSYDCLMSKPEIKSYYKGNISMLKSRSLEKKSEWYGFGRSQGIKDVSKNKFSINTLLRNISDIKLTICPSGTGVYSGLYILTEATEQEVKSLLFTEDFISYISMLGKYKSGGYYTFSSKDLQQYLNYKYLQKRGI